MTSYQYIESGLDNVFIEGLVPVVDSDGDEVITIQCVAGLHTEIARGIISRDGHINGKELRFLRTEMGLTQANLAAKLSVDGQTIGRWERGETTIDSNAEIVLRRLAGENLIVAFDLKMEELLSRQQSTESDPQILVEANENGYKLCA